MFINDIQIINATPHPVTLLLDDETIMIPIELEPIRLKSETVKVGKLFSRTKFSAETTDSLPEKRDNVFYIVSQLVKSAIDRDDLVVPAEVQRDETGRIVGCKSLGL